MTPPRPETEQDIDWLGEWESNTNARYRGKIEARLVKNESEVREYINSM